MQHIDRGQPNDMPTSHIWVSDSALSKENRQRDGFVRTLLATIKSSGNTYASFFRMNILLIPEQVHIPLCVPVLSHVTNTKYWHTYTYTRRAHYNGQPIG